MLIGAKELGETVFDVKDGKMTMGLSEDVARKLWDNYYVPYIKGWAAASGHFRSDDIKIGSILAYIGSNSSATYFPTQVMLSDTESHDIELKVLPTPHFEGCEKVSVQQGAGMAVAKTTDAEVEASVVFLKWSPSRRTTSHLQWVPAICRDPCRQRYGCYPQQRPRPDRQHEKRPDGGRGRSEYQ